MNNRDRWDNKMNDQKIKEKVHESITKLVEEKGYVAPVDVFTEMDILIQKDYEEWRRGKVKYLERVIKVNLRKISVVMKEIKNDSLKMNLKPSITIYNQWGKNKGIRLQFSKSGNKKIEDAYSTHYVKRK